MKVLTEEVRNGLHDGKVFWICHYNQPDLNKKPLRNIPPTKVVVLSNSELPTNKTVYYSKSHFRPLNKAGNPTSKIISPVDNTGYRSLCGNELFVFDNEAECNAEWNGQIDKVVLAVEFEIKTAQTMWINRKNSLLEMIK